MLKPTWEYGGSAYEATRMGGIVEKIAPTLHNDNCTRTSARHPKTSAFAGPRSPRRSRFASASSLRPETAECHSEQAVKANLMQIECNGRARESDAILEPALFAGGNRLTIERVRIRRACHSGHQADFARCTRSKLSRSQ